MKSIFGYVLLPAKIVVLSMMAAGAVVCLAGVIIGAAAASKLAR